MPTDGQIIKGLREAIGSAFNLNELSDLVGDLGVEVGEDQVPRLDRITGVTNGLDESVQRLVDWCDRRGYVFPLIRVTYRARPKHEGVHDFCQKWAQWAFEPQPAPTEMAARVGAMLGEVVKTASGAQGDRVKKIVESFKEDFKSARECIDLLAKYKALHENLHTIDFQLFGNLARTARVFRTDEDERVALHVYTKQLDDLLDAAVEIVKGMPQQSLEDGWIASMRRVAQLFESALNDSGNDPDRFEGTAVRLLQGLLSREPSRINSRMVDLAEQLQKPLQELTEALGQVQDTAPAVLTQQLCSGRATLQELCPRLILLTRQHTAWQDIDNKLRLIPKGAKDSLDDARVLWPDISAATTSLCNQEPQSAWSVELAAAARRFDVASDAQTTYDLRIALMDFTGAARKRFVAVDSQLNNVCGSMVQIALPLDALLDTIGK